MSKAVVLASGGMDSATCAYLAAAEGNDLVLVSVDYGPKRNWPQLERWLDDATAQPDLWSSTRP